MVMSKANSSFFFLVITYFFLLLQRSILRFYFFPRKCKKNRPQNVISNFLPKWRKKNVHHFWFLYTFWQKMRTFSGKIVIFSMRFFFFQPNPEKKKTVTFCPYFQYFCTTDSFVFNYQEKKTYLVVIRVCKFQPAKYGYLWKYCEFEQKFQEKMHVFWCTCDRINSSWYKGFHGTAFTFCNFLWHF